jgi:GNAT superfamily N-acetyltransferase
VPSFTVLPVEWNDPRAVALRRLMDVEMSARYSSGGPADPAVQRALTIDPATVVATLLALDEAGEPIGHAALRRHGEEWEVKRVIVTRSARGRGVGRALLAGIERIASEGGAERLILQTGDKQPEAIGLYTRIGYQPIPVYEPYASAMPFSLCYAKELNP